MHQCFLAEAVPVTKQQEAKKTNLQEVKVVVSLVHNLLSLCLFFHI